MADEYKTLSKDGFFEFTEKRSRFLGYAKPVSTEAEALNFIASIKDANKTANHNVYAYSLRENNLLRYSDDGEPQGTAGLPVLDILKRGEIVDAAIVVTRYFGGTLLGTGGLVRAYSDGAAGAVNEAGIAVMRMCAIYEIGCGYADYDKLLSVLSKVGATVASSDYADEIKIEASIMKTESEKLTNALRELFRGKERLRLVNEKFVPVLNE